MDLATLIADKSLLANLAREYELLKATNAMVNYEEWITKRLRHAAAARQGTQHSKSDSWSCSAAVHHNIGNAEVGAGLSVGTAPDVPALAATQQAWQATNVTNTAPIGVQQALNGQSEQYGQQKTAEHAVGMHMPMHSSDCQTLQGSSGLQPRWVAAAKLQASLQASRIVPVKHAAADRERRLAALAALARQQLSVKGDDNNSGSSSIGPVEAKHKLLRQHRHCSRETAVQPQQLQQVVQLTQQVVQQNQLLQEALKQQQDQLQKHEELLAASSALTFRQHQNVNVLGTAQQAQAATSTMPAGQDVPANPGVQNQLATAEPSKMQELPNAVKNSWLVRSLLGSGANKGPVSSAKSGAGPKDAPDFTQLTKQTSVSPEQSQQSLQTPDQQQELVHQQQQMPHKQQPPVQQQQQQQLPSEGSHRAELQAAFRQLISTGKTKELHLGLATLLQSLCIIQQQPQQLGPADQQEEQDENSQPANGWQRPVQAASPGHKAGRRSAQHLAANQLSSRGSRRPDYADCLTDRKASQQQQQPQQHKPGWNSEPFVPPPAKLLRQRLKGAAEAWEVTLDKPRKPAGTPARLDGATKHKPPGRSKGPKKGRQNVPVGLLNSRKAVSFAARALGRGVAQAPVHVTLTSSWQNLTRKAAEPGQHSPGSQRNNSAAQAAAGPGMGVAPAAAGGAANGLAAMSAEQVQLVEHAVQQQLQLETRQEDKHRLLRLEEAASHILSTLGCLEQHLHRQNSIALLAPSAADGPAQPAGGSAGCYAGHAAGGGASGDSIQQPCKEVSNLLLVLDRLQMQEQAIHKRWFGGSSNHDGNGGSHQAAVLSASSHLQGPDVSASQVAEHPGATVQQQMDCAAGGGNPSAKTETPVPCSITTAMNQPEAATANTSQGSLHQQSEPTQQLQPEVLTSEMVKSITAGRKRFLRHQAKLDDQLGGSSSRGSYRHGSQALQPTYVVEAVADLLLDEMLLQQMGDLDEFVDAVCDQLLEDEFELE